MDHGRQYDDYVKMLDAIVIYPILYLSSITKTRIFHTAKALVQNFHREPTHH